MLIFTLCSVNLLTFFYSFAPHCPGKFFYHKFFLLVYLLLKYTVLYFVLQYFLLLSNSGVRVSLRSNSGCHISMISSGSSVSVSQALLTLWHHQTPTFRSASLSVLNKQTSSKKSCCRAPPWITPFTPASLLSAQSVFLPSQPMFCPP